MRSQAAHTASAALSLQDFNKLLFLAAHTALFKSKICCALVLMRKTITSFFKSSSWFLIKILAGEEGARVFSMRN